MNPNHPWYGIVIPTFGVIWGHKSTWIILSGCPGWRFRVPDDPGSGDKTASDLSNPPGVAWGITASGASGLPSNHGHRPQRMMGTKWSGGPDEVTGHRPGVLGTGMVRPTSEHQQKAENLAFTPKTLKTRSPIHVMSFSSCQ